MKSSLFSGDAMGGVRHHFVRYLPAILSGVLLTLSFPNGNRPWLAWIALIPLLLAIKANNAKTKQNQTAYPLDGGFAFKAGFWTGLVHYLSLLYWIVPTVSIFGNLPIFLAVPILCCSHVILRSTPHSLPFWATPSSRALFSF